MYMPFYYYVSLFIVLSVIFCVIRYIVLRKKHISVELFSKALKNENNGHYEEAVATYKIALSEVKKLRFHSRLQHKIIEKIKLLHTLIEYKNSHR